MVRWFWRRPTGLVPCLPCEGSLAEGAASRGLQGPRRAPQCEPDTQAGGRRDEIEVSEPVHMYKLRCQSAGTKSSPVRQLLRRISREHSSRAAASKEEHFLAAMRIRHLRTGLSCSLAFDFTQFQAFPGEEPVLPSNRTDAPSLAEHFRKLAPSSPASPKPARSQSCGPKRSPPSFKTPPRPRVPVLKALPTSASKSSTSSSKTIPKATPPVRVVRKASNLELGSLNAEKREAANAIERARTISGRRSSVATLNASAKASVAAGVYNQEQASMRYGALKKHNQEVESFNSMVTNQDHGTILEH
ncbi:hypothetical protein CYMTET_56386 [Cymbomonas tetramitiformis]|uniref:Uncharacterized protein n=1 Tax=Cymbomonas tetramitiformis TaxID=36881 RepID=A0AAE0EMD6_9CHLO|nr:hypothetical protein CYMTET_56386 [Cymbomonas tetramitiformis]